MSTATKKFVIFNNFSELPFDKLYPMAEQIHFGFYWRVSVRQTSSRVTFCLACRLPNSRKTESIVAGITYRIVWADGTSETGTSNHRFHSGSLPNACYTISSRARKFMLELRVEVTVRFQDIFLKNHERVLLKVGGTAIHVPTKLLEAHFKKFQPKISEQYRIDSSIQDFMDLLFIVEGYRVLNKKNVVNILRIAKTHGVDTVVKQCEQFLMKKSMKPSVELIRIAEKYSLDSLKSSIENSIVSAEKVSEKPEKTVKPNENREVEKSTTHRNTREFVISVEYDGFHSGRIFHGREEFHSNFYWSIHIAYKKRTLRYGLECRPMSEWNNKLLLTARIEPCVIFKTKYVKSKPSGFQFDGFNQIFWNNVQKRASQLRVEFKVEVTEVVGFGVVTNALQLTNETVVLTVEGKKFKFPKMFLTLHFKNSQSTLSECQKEFEMDASLEDFEKLLSVLDGFDVIDDKNVLGIVSIAHKYGVEIVIRKCEQFLIERSEKSSESLQKIAKDFNLDMLKHSWEQQQPNENVMKCLECPVCYRTYTDIPRILQCGHSFCLECLYRLRVSTCPICCRPFVRGSSTPNYGLKNVMDAALQNQTPNKPERASPIIQNRAVSNDPERMVCSIM